MYSKRLCNENYLISYSCLSKNSQQFSAKYICSNKYSTFRSCILFVIFFGFLENAHNSSSVVINISQKIRKTFVILIIFISNFSVTFLLLTVISVSLISVLTLYLRVNKKKLMGKGLIRKYLTIKNYQNENLS